MTMGKRIIAVNAGPRKGWNTDTLIMEAAKGAESEFKIILPEILITNLPEIPPIFASVN